MISLLKRNILLIIGAILGGLAGYLYYKFLGCASGTCTITSKPINSTIYGIVLGCLLADMIKSMKKK